MINRLVRNILMNVIYAASAAFVVILDQVTKKIIQSAVPVGGSIEVIKNFLYITHVKNTGAAFRIFQNKTDILIIISIIALILIIVLRFD